MGNKIAKILLSLMILSSPLISSAAKLSEDDLAKKKQEPYIVGLPLINASSDNGVGYGARVYWYDPGTSEDEYFDSTPYFTQIYLQLFRTTGGMQYHSINLDKYNVAGTKFRFKTEVAYDATLNANFFGIGKDASDQNLTGNGVEYDSYSDYYDEFLDQGGDDNNNRKYNNYTIKKPTVWFRLYYNLMDWFKLMAGGQFMKVDIDPWGDRDFKSKIFGGDDYTASETLLEQYDRDALTGYDGGWTNFAIFGAAIDTRDFEPNPKQGVLLEYTFLKSGKALGSDYTYHVHTAGARGYYTLFKKLTFGIRTAYFESSSETPFYELGEFNFFDKRQSGIGGNRTNLGYKNKRFIGHTLTLGQLELRYFVGDTKLGSQLFGLQIVAFMDTGNVYDYADEPFNDPRWSDYKTSYGGGLAIPWNLNTIVHMFYAQSKEDAGFSIDFMHKF